MLELRNITKRFGDVLANDNVNIVVKPGETERIAGFYSDVLGLRPTSKPAEGTTAGGAWFDIDGTTQLHISERADAVMHDDMHFGLIVDDFDATLARLAEIADAAAALARDAAAGRINPDKVTDRVLARYLDEPEMPDVDLFVRSSGEQRTSNFLLWQSAYAEMVFQDTLWPDYDRRQLWAAIEEYAQRDRRYGGLDAT